MRPGRASRTAEHNALFRALESAAPPGRRLFEDPLARRFLSFPLSWVGALAAVPGLRGLATGFIDRRWPGVRTSLVARTRHIDEAVARAVAEPVEQAVVLGAGFDARAWRLPALRGVPVFEVDHPDTQAAKRAALERAGIVARGSVRFVATDFTAGDLEARMAAAGYREPARTLVVWEGVTNYLTAASVDATLRWCARAQPGSPVIFTYVDADLFAHPEAYAGSARLFGALERVGERFTFGLDPGALRDYLARRGLVLEGDTGAAAYRARWYGAAARRMRGHEFYRVAVARVAAPVPAAGAPARGTRGARLG